MMYSDMRVVGFMCVGVSEKTGTRHQTCHVGDFVDHAGIFFHCKVT